MAGQVPFPRPGGVVGGKYVLEAMLDSDASGAVFRARHSSTGRPFAIRWLTRSSKAGVSLPPTAAKNAPPLDDCYQNPAISAPLDLGRTPHGTYIVMEWLNGETLATRIACEGALPLTAAAELLVPCMRALQQLHQVHVELGGRSVCAGTRR
jgi:eukaryotic-like serine/threonine-protein kinase